MSIPAPSVGSRLVALGTAVVIVAGGAVATAAPAAANPVDDLLAALIPDLGLRQCIEDEAASSGLLSDLLGTALGAVEGVLASLTGSLDCADDGIVDLTGIDALTGLSSIDVRGNSIVDLSPLADAAARTHLVLLPWPHFAPTTIVATGQIVDLGHLGAGASVVVPLPADLAGDPITLTSTGAVAGAVDAATGTITWAAQQGAGSLTWDDGAGFTGTITAILDPILGPVFNDPSISGTAQVGRTLTAISSTSGGSGTFDYQWKRTIGGVTTSIPGAVSATRTLNAGDLGATVTVDVTAHLLGLLPITKTTPATDVVLPGVLVAAPAVVTGTAQVGRTLASTDGSWTPAAALTRVWLRDGAPIDGATRSFYRITDADLGAVLSVRVTGTAAGYTPLTIDSVSTAAVIAAAPVAPTPSPGPTTPTTSAAGALQASTPTIEGAAVFRETLTAVPGSWDPAAALSYQWYRGDAPVPDATATVYTVQLTDIGSALSVKVTGTKAGSSVVSLLSAPTPAIAKRAFAPAAKAVVKGHRAVGVRLRAVLKKAGAPAALSYRWTRDGRKIAGGTSRTYVLTTKDRGHVIAVRITARSRGYLTLVARSASSARVVR